MQSDERQRNILGKLSEGLDRLLLASTEPSLGRSPNDVPNISQEMVALTMKTNMDMGRDVQNIARKVSVLNDEQEQRMRGVMTEVKHCLHTSPYIIGRRSQKYRLPHLT